MHDKLIIRMLKICDDSFCGPLRSIYQSCFENGKFPSEWKKWNVVPTYKKNNKQLVKNYRPISLLPICGKVFERLIYNKLFNFFQENNLTSPNQSRFEPGDSCTNQLLAITHEIYTSLFSIVHDPNATANDLNNDLMTFNPDPFKQAQEILFSRKIKSQDYPCLHSNNNPVNQTPLQKHLRM